ncbi:hypothetical protein T440DRAFT_395284 [Plenodomus tracheiphilus IPT5]|uniref:LysR family regulatory protein n=1 Tax=Plenodomus tracheiphilus IPT5 TaxID=1408161 RepID=A0A6A7BA68_9PLEO|nr:hypothetical protein T440DRAFT_395284 [Plenodomus tracheiphilus IPT5]
MAALWKWISGRPTVPERVPTDTVIPLHRFDDTVANRSINFEYHMQFEEVLDAEKIAAALWKLLERPGWRKLGARLRQNDKGKLEYHIPAHYTKERPPINFSKIGHNLPLADHRLSKVLPRPNGTLQSFDTAPLLSEHLDLKDHPRYLADWLYTDKPQLGLHIVTFTDATFITMTWNHTLFDAMGQRALFDAWIAMLEGRENDIPEFVGYDSDPLDALGAPVSSSPSNAKDDAAPVIEEFVLKDRFLTGLSKLYLIFNYMWEAIFHPSESPHMVCMPGTYLEHLRREAYADLATAPDELLTYTNNNSAPSNTPPKPFISDGDILLSWTFRLLTASNPTLLSPPRPLLVLNVMDVRSLLSTTTDGYASLIPKSKAYVYNCVTASFSFFPRAIDMLTQPLGHVAARIRKDLATQRRRAQVEAVQRLARDTPFPMFGSGNMGLSAFSNWEKAKFFGLDFGAAAAVVGENAATHNTKTNNMRKTARPIYIQPFCTTPRGFIIRGAANCIGVDGKGNVWISCMIRSEFTPLLEAEIGKLAVAAAGEVSG